MLITELPDPVHKLEGFAMEEYKRAGNTLIGLGLLFECDLYFLSSYSMHIGLLKVIDNLMVSSQPEDWPVLTKLRTPISDVVVKLSSLLRLNPSARKSLITAKTEVDDKFDPLAGLDEE